MSSAFDQLITPVDRGTFDSHYWNRKPGQFRCAPGLLDALLNEPAVLELETLAAAGHESYRILPGKRDTVYSGGGSEALRVWRSMPAVTVTAEFAQLTLPVVMSYVTTLMKTIGVPFQWCWPNLYYSRVGSGFSRHWDNHENFIVGLKGFKRFTVAPNRCLPYPSENAGYFVPPIEGLQRVVEAERDAPTLPGTVEFDIGPGDCIFIPRGWWHEAHALEGGSTTLTWAVSTCTWANLLEAGGIEPPAEATALALRTPLPLDARAIPDAFALSDHALASLFILRAQLELRSIAEVVRDWRVGLEKRARLITAHAS